MATAYVTTEAMLVFTKAVWAEEWDITGKEMCIRDRPKVDPTEYIPVLMYHHFAVRDMGFGDGITTMPVSYTHLDVYKRQRIHCAGTAGHQCGTGNRTEHGRICYARNCGTVYACDCFFQLL